MSIWNLKLFSKVKGEANRPSIWTLKTGCCVTEPAGSCCNEERLRRLTPKTIWDTVPNIWGVAFGSPFNGSKRF